MRGCYSADDDHDALDEWLEHFESWLRNGSIRLSCVVIDGLGALGHDDSLELWTVARFPGSKREPSEQKAVPVKVSTGSICALLTLKREGDAPRRRKAGLENTAYARGLNWWATIGCAR